MPFYRTPDSTLPYSQLVRLAMGRPAPCPPRSHAPDYPEAVGQLSYSCPGPFTFDRWASPITDSEYYQDCAALCQAIGDWSEAAWYLVLAEASEVRQRTLLRLVS